MKKETVSFIHFQASDAGTNTVHWKVGSGSWITSIKRLDYTGFTILNSIRKDGAANKAYRIIGSFSAKYLTWSSRYR
jgi:hypothetical protein